MLLDVNLSITKGFNCFLMTTQKSFAMINVVLSTTPYISPHVCKVLSLPKQDRVMATLVSIGTHDLMRKFSLPNDRAAILHK